ncbi:hypothetical protein [Methylophilus sp. YYY-1]|uniref:SH3 domain-containing protein n=1 Tax=Methylophilus glucosoxydans TaxID=752553 RepID=A0ABW3GP33_9PROT|nr:hypothetical protein [Methylophilus sp. YYY-1]MDF0378408.1 hypothetical protein [Methylophilus sp. YYY-1]
MVSIDIRRFFTVILLLFIPLITGAAPLGNAPQNNYSVPQFWNICLNPVTVLMQQPSVIYSSTSKKSKVVAKLSRKEKVSVVEAVDIVIKPGVAKVVGDFENNYLKLSVGTEVYVLAEWEIDYAHAWYAGKAVEGGLPIFDPSAFSIIKKPTIERWLKIKNSQSPYKSGWALDSEAFSDNNAISTCKRAYEQ